jgi:hypothetical protein
VSYPASLAGGAAAHCTASRRDVRAYLMMTSVTVTSAAKAVYQLLRSTKKKIYDIKLKVLPTFQKHHTMSYLQYSLNVLHWLQYII